MLKEVQDIIKRIENYLSTNESFVTVIEEDGVSIRVFDNNGESNIYHGYELCLLEKVVAALDCSLDLKVVKDGDAERFVVTTDANYNLMSYINSTNNKLRSFQDDEVNTVYLCEKLANESHGNFSILTGYGIGTWSRCDITKSELLYAAVFDLPITQNDSGVFWYNDLIEMNNKFFDELEALHKTN